MLLGSSFWVLLAVDGGAATVGSGKSIDGEFCADDFFSFAFRFRRDAAFLEDNDLSSEEAGAWGK